MKYQLTSLHPKNKTQLTLENIIPAKTEHIRGYGLGVTFSSCHYSWQQTSTFLNLKLHGHSPATIVAP